LAAPPWHGRFLCGGMAPKVNSKGFISEFFPSNDCPFEFKNLKISSLSFLTATLRK